MFEKEKAAWEQGKRIQFERRIDPHYAEWATLARKGEAGEKPEWHSSLSYRIHPDDVSTEEESNMSFKKGDRVTRNELRDGSFEYCIGYTGTVMAGDRETFGVRWDEHSYSSTSDHHWMNAKHLSKVPKPDSKEVQAALALLKRAGTVTFVPAKPPFSNVTVKLNSSYTANVSELSVKVGCQTFSFENVDALAAAVKAARDYNNS